MRCVSVCFISVWPTTTRTRMKRHENLSRFTYSPPALVLPFLFPVLAGRPLPPVSFGLLLLMDIDSVGSGFIEITSNSAHKHCSYTTVTSSQHTEYYNTNTEAGVSISREQAVSQYQVLLVESRISTSRGYNSIYNTNKELKS